MVRADRRARAGLGTFPQGRQRGFGHLICQSAYHADALAMASMVIGGVSRAFVTLVLLPHALGMYSGVRRTRVPRGLRRMRSRTRPEGQDENEAAENHAKTRHFAGTSKATTG